MATILERNKKVKAPKKTHAEHMEDALYREVWEDVNNEKTIKFIKKYSKHMIVGALVLMIIATGFQIGIRAYREHKIATAITYENALLDYDANALAALADNTSGATADLALFQAYLLDNDVLKHMFDHIYISQTGDIELVPKVGNHIVVLGSIDNLDEKFENLLAVYKEGFANSGWDKYVKLNLKYKNQVVCTKK